MAALKSVSLLTFFALTLPNLGRVEEEINETSPHLTPKIPPLFMKEMNGFLCRNPIFEEFFQH